MPVTAYPTALADIPLWCRETAKTTSEGNVRFVEYVLLTCIASDVIACRSLVLKGGNALRFAYQSPRSTKDLDFSVDTNDITDNEESIRKLLDAAFRHGERRHNVKAKCQRVRRNPRSPEATRQTYDVTVGYQLPGDAYFNDFANRNVTTVIPLEISFNDRVCETSQCPGVTLLRVCSLEDILAEKLRSILQQKIRNRNRCQDVYDISRNLRAAKIDRSKISRYLLEKAAVREVPVTKASFDDVARDMASKDYDKQIHEQAPHDFIPFDVAWAEVVSLVQSLDIPD